MAACLYLDESGDLGWTLDKEFGKGGSSQHLTIAGVFVSHEDQKHVGRLVKSLYKRHKWDSKTEMKWTYMDHRARLDFANLTVRLLENHPNIRLQAAVLNKPLVYGHLRLDEPLLYNFLVKEGFLGHMATHQNLTLIPDPKSIAPKSGSPLHTYLRQSLFDLAFQTGVPVTQLGYKELDSASCKELQFADMLAGAIQLHYAGVCSEYFEILEPKLYIKEMFFN